MPMLTAFRTVNSAIKLDLVTGNVALNLFRRDADVAVCATDAPPETLVGRRVARIAWALYGAVETVYGSDPAESAAWVCLGDNLASMEVVRFAQSAIAPERLAARFDTVGGLTNAVAAGIGVGHLPCFAGDVRSDLVRLSAPNPAYASDLWLLTHTDLRHTPRIRALLDFLSETLAVRRSPIEGLEGAVPSPGVKPRTGSVS